MFESLRVYIKIVETMTPRQKEVLLKAARDVEEGRASFRDNDFCTKVQADLENARALELRQD